MAQFKVASTADLAPGEAKCVEVAGKKIALFNLEGNFYAIDDTCTHRGGPLSDGALIDCKVQCPWHGSQFDITTGRVVAGPAERKIEVFETEERKGEIYLAPKRDEIKKAA